MYSLKTYYGLGSESKTGSKNILSLLTQSLEARKGKAYIEKNIIQINIQYPVINTEDPLHSVFTGVDGFAQL